MSDYLNTIAAAKLAKEQKERELAEQLEIKRQQGLARKAKLEAFFDQIVLPELNKAQSALQSSGISAERGNASDDSNLRYTLRLPSCTPCALVFILSKHNLPTDEQISYDIKHMGDEKDHGPLIKATQQNVQKVISDFITQAIS